MGDRSRTVNPLKRKFKKPRWLTEESESHSKTSDFSEANSLTNGGIGGLKECSVNLMRELSTSQETDQISSDQTSEDEMNQEGNEKSKIVKISKAGKSDQTKGSTPSPRKKDRSSVEQSSSIESPSSSQSSDEQFLGFEDTTANDIKSEKQDQLLKLLGKLNTGRTDKASSSQVDEGGPIAENESESSNPEKINEELPSTEAKSKVDEEVSTTEAESECPNPPKVDEEVPSAEAQSKSPSSAKIDEEVPKSKAKVDEEVPIFEAESGGKKASEQEEDMIVEEGGQISDSDSEQMEIDMGQDKDDNSKADFAEFDGNEKPKDTEAEDVDVENDSTTSDTKPETAGKTDEKTDSEQTTIPESEPPKEGEEANIEYCGGCSAKVDDAEDGICCDGPCQRWFHLRCSGLSDPEYDELSRDENAKWACCKCSGKPPPPLTVSRPLLSVRKDLTKVSTPSPKRSPREGRTPRVDLSNPAFLKPFDYGWKRELVYRSTNDSKDRRQGDIYYYSPKGKKLRSLRETIDHLTGTDLTQDNFTFFKEPLGINDPEKEIIREAKIKVLSKDPSASPSVPKKSVTPKTPKASKSTPKLTATVTPLDTSGASAVPLKASACITPRIVFKGKAAGPKFKVTASKTTSPGQAHKIVISKEKKKKSESDDEMEMGMLPPMWEPMPKPKDNKGAAVCSIRCLPAMGLIPTLQCHVCLCLYHPECVGLGEEAKHHTIHHYKCKNCQMETSKPPVQSNNTKPIQSPPPLTPITTLGVTSPTNTAVSPPSLTPPKLQRMDMGGGTTAKPRAPIPKAPSIVGGVTTWLPPSSTIQMRPQTPAQKQMPPSPTNTIDPLSSLPVQTIVSMDGKRYIVIPKHNVLSVSPATTSSPQVPDLVGSKITTTASSDPVPHFSPPTFASQAVGAGGPILPKPQVPITSSAAFIMSPTTTTSSFQSPPGVLLVPYISPQPSTPPKDGQQPQYIVVNGSSGLQSGNFIIGNIPQQQQLKLPTIPTSQPAEPTTPDLGGVKRPLESGESSPAAKRPKAYPVISQFHPQNTCYTYEALKQAFQYLKVQELLRAGRVCKLWHDLAFHYSLWETVRMKNSQVKDWEGFAATLKRTNTRQLDLRKILVPDKPEAQRAMWNDCVKALGKVTNLSRLDLCRCTAQVLEQVAAACPHLDSITAGALRSNQLDLASFKTCENLTELKLKSLSGMQLNNATSLVDLPKLKHLSLTTVKNMTAVLEVIEKLTQLESLELGEMVSASEESATQAFSQLTKLRRLRLEKGQQDCPTDAILRTISKLPNLVQLELINFDIKVGFEESLPLCSNIKILLIIPTYVTQSATTNHLVIEGVSKLSKTLNHFVWGLTIELLRVTDLFIDQWESQKSGNKGPSPQQQQKKTTGDSIPILKPAVKDAKQKPKDGAGPVTQVDVLQLPKLHKVLTTFLPNTKIIILKVPFSATWRQTISNTAQ